jgi:hypothetical protein
MRHRRLPGARAQVHALHALRGLLDASAAFGYLDGDALDLAKDQARAVLANIDAPIASRWRCPHCKSLHVQVSFPTWYHESINVGGDTDLLFVETDAEADISWWYCEDCDESDDGQPEDVLDDI